ncbi:helix-turn-helix transcriptional regulator [Hymenobacter weizhouensis]|uniref:helix-turn-helix transcriptional regulator n=1 Tax=Hymenobacter sp. YIM 151500-1 TaxID=2987689 RepID=UPI002226E5B8|nr:helix-turn-helix transcriptional regulator [Hymenobacter sp. YIM 151500-1]UYZ63950.1 helix-turn-helix transcriptional regulator [Hymenobacter sp. YIM 151500-1]
MPRKSIPSTTLLAQVRKYFGLEQQELGTYLGISRQYVADIEAGRRTLTSKVLLRLAPLAAQLPPEAPARLAAPAPEEPPHGAPAPGPLEARLNTCRHQAAKLRRELRQLAAGQAQARRWQQVLPVLLAQAEAAAPTDTHAARAHQWLRSRQEQASAALHDADLAARYYLLQARATALETEAATLARQLESGGAQTGTKNK